MNNSRPSFLSNIPPVTLNLLIINVICWLAAILLPSRFGIDLTDILGLHHWSSDKFFPTQLITYMFMHDTSSFSHIFFNMFGVLMFGIPLERMWGSWKYLFYYLIAGVGAGITQEITWMVDLHGIVSAMNDAIAANSGEPLVPYAHMFTGGNIAAATGADVFRLKQQMLSHYITVGASGSLFGILLPFGWLFPQAKMMLIFLPIPIPSRIFVAIYAVVELFLGVSNFAVDNVAHFAHLGGMIFGAIVLLVWQRQHKLYS